MLQDKLKKMHREDGFTMIELMVALTIIMVVIMYFGSFLIDGLELSNSNKEENTALAVAQEKMEQIKAVWPKKPVDFAKVPVDPNNSAVGDGQTYGEYTGTITRNNKEFTRYWKWTRIKAVENPTPDTTANPHYLYQVEVKVSWIYKDRSGNEDRSVYFTTYMTGR